MEICKENNLCTACGSCENICPKGAISMKEDEYGFLFPFVNEAKCIHCGLCKKVCQNASNIIKNLPINTLACQSKNYELSKKSSSGGMFAELARYVLAQNGIVFGCAMERTEDKFEVKHIYIEAEKDLYKLQGAKYVQSQTGKSYQEAKVFLEQERLVLYSGTPCQIAGLKAFLQKNYENLICVDLSCTGVPSLKLFNDYINFLEHKYKKKVTNFEFRNKEKIGWNCGNCLITFENGKQKILFNNISSYMKLFINKQLQKKNCQKCSFSGLERVSDITIADAWGIDNEYPKLLKNKFEQTKGISLITLNNEKVCALFENIKDNLLYENINIYRFIKYNNPLNKNRKNRADYSYLEVYKNQGFIAVNELFKQKLGKKYRYYHIKNYIPKFIKKFIKLFFPKKSDCLLMTLYCLPNYGSLLTVYALSKTISEIGFSNQIIHYGNLFGFGNSFVKKYLKLTKRCVNNKDFISLNKITDTFILGSDNLLDFSHATLGFISRNLFNFTDKNKKRIMISGSFGNWNGSTKTSEEKNYIKNLLSRFDYLSTREKTGKNIIEKEYDIQADWINDPVFYLHKEEYKKLAENSSINISDNDIMQYVLYPNEETNKIIEYFKNKYNSNIIKFDGNENVTSKNKNDSPENWLYAIKKSKLIITDSFHCVCFALIFNKPFICIKNTHATTRFTSLFEKLGIYVNLVQKVEDVKDQDLTINFEIVNENIEKIRNFAINKLFEVLSLQKENSKDNEEFIQLNNKYFSLSDKWYKKSKLFYYFIIIPFIIRIKNILHDFK